MAAIPHRPEDELPALIYRAYEERAAKRPGVYLARIGASQLGTPCLRKLFLDWRAYARPPIRGQILRLFGTGHQQEARVVEDLRAAGMRVWDRDAETGKQLTYVDPETGHLVDKIDGVVKGVPGDEETPHVLEIKTHNDKQWQALNKARSVSHSHPEHYVQCQTGIWLTGLTKALYVGLNKNDESYYPEVIVRNDKAIAWAEERVDQLYRASLIPAGVSADGSAYVCGLCDQRAPCLGAEPLKSCRTCRHVEPGPHGSWLCNLWEKSLDWDEQRAACDRWDPLRAEPVGK